MASSCWAAAGGEVCSEQVLISAARNALPSAVVPLLLSDLPAFVWWQGAIGMDDEVLTELIELSDRLIVDSDEAGVEAVERITPAATRPVRSGVGPNRTLAGGSCRHVRLGAGPGVP